MQMKDRNTRTAEFLESHPFGMVAGDVRLKSRTIELNRNLRHVPLDPTVVKLPHCQEDWDWICGDCAGSSNRRP